MSKPEINIKNYINVFGNAKETIENDKEMLFPTPLYGKKSDMSSGL